MLGVVQPVPVHGGVFGGLQGEIQKECDINPYLKKAGIVVKVEDVTDGYVTIGVVGGVSDGFMEKLYQGKSLSDIGVDAGMSRLLGGGSSDYTALETLKRLEEVLKKRSDVKDVVWTLAKETKQKLDAKKAGAKAEAKAARKKAEAAERAFKSKFKDNEDGTVTDTRNGLTGLKNVGCFGKLSWGDAKDAVRKLSDGVCGLSGGFETGDWRLPTKDELPVLLDWKNSGAFFNIRETVYGHGYVSSDKSGGRHSYPITIRLSSGHVGWDDRPSFFVWPVLVSAEDKDRIRSAQAKLEQLLNPLPAEFVGESSTGGKDQRWPMRVRIVAHDRSSHDVEGEIEWPTEKAVHRIKGTLEGGLLVIRETDYIRKGKANLGCIYKLQLEGTVLAGTWGSCNGSSHTGQTRLDRR